MKKEIKILSGLSIILLGTSIICSFLAVYVIDGSRIKHQYRVPVPTFPNEDLVYYEWEPMIGSPDRENHVVFLFAGFLAQQPMMYPLAREFTRQGYHVITGDFRGHGESGGKFTMNWTVLLDDFNAIFEDVKLRRSNEWNLTHIAVGGHSMGGFAAIMFGAKVPEIWTTVALAPAPYVGYINETSPRNLLIIIGSQDQAFTTDVELTLFQKAVPNGEVGKLYGNPLEGTAKKMVIAPWARHENELTDDYCLSQSVSFVEWGFGYMKPGDEFLANQTNRMDFIMISLLLGAIGVCMLFLLINRIEIKPPENPRLQKLFNNIIGGYFSQNNRPQVKIEEEDLNSPFIASWADANALFTPDDRRQHPITQYVKDWYTWYVPSFMFSFALFVISLFVMPDVFSNFQILLLGTPGLTSIGVAYQNYKRNRGEYHSFWNYLSPLRYQMKREYTPAAWLIGLAFYGLMMFLLLFGYGQEYMFLFPMNRRIFNLFFLIPFIFIMYMFQTWAAFYHLVDRMRTRKHAGIYSWITILLTKHTWVILISIIMLFLGNTMITIMALLTFFDLLATSLLILNYRYNRNYGAINIWAVITMATVYLGYAGVISAWEIIFGKVYNGLYWLG